MVKQSGVVHVSSRYPPDVGGMERVVKELSEALGEEMQASVEVVSGGRGESLGTSYEGNLVVRRLWHFNVAVTPVIPGLSWKLLRGPRPKLFHVHVAHATTPEVVALVARLRGVPFVAHVHIDASPTTWMGRLLGSYQKHVLSRVLARAAMVVVPTDSYRTLMLDKYELDPVRVRVLANGTNMPKRGDGEASSWKHGSPVHLVSVGRVAREKNLPLLLEAVELLVNEDNLDVQLEIVGDGPDWDRVHQHIEERGLGARVQMIGRRSGNDLVEAYDRADIFVMTSSSESFGMVLVEAMARGIPVVAPDIPGVRDVVIDGVTGLLIDHSAESIRGAVLRILEDPTQREALIAGARAQSGQYEWAAIAQHCVELYEEVLRSTGDDSHLPLAPPR
jgi:glycosyltransferase involved in cell wall biosynthesis